MMDLYLLSKYRTQLMGIAALFIIICHAPVYGVELPHYVRMLFVWGNIGVDMFLFLSGLGCFYSLSHYKQKKCNWILKRYKRIAIPYIIIQVVFLAYFVCCSDFRLSSWLLEFSTISFWTNHIGCWYIAFLIPVYAIAPFMFVCLKTQDRYRHIVFFVLLVLTIVIVNTGNVDVKDNTSILYNIKWAFKRFPGFLLGMYLAPYILSKKKIHIVKLLGMTAIGFLLFNTVFSSVYGWWLYVPLICLVCSYFVKLLLDETVINSFLKWMGGASLESYVTNIQTKAIMPSIMSSFSDKPLLYGHYFDYTLVIILGLFLTYYCHNLSKLIAQKI